MICLPLQPSDRTRHERLDSVEARAMAELAGLWFGLRRWSGRCGMFDCSRRHGARRGEDRLGVGEGVSELPIEGQALEEVS